MVFEGISAEQEEIRRLLFDEGLTPKQIAKRRNTGLSAVYKTISKLRLKGIVGRGLTQGVENSTPGGVKSVKKGAWRLHGQHFVLKIYWKSDSYDLLKEKRNLLIVDGNVVKVHREGVEVYCSPSRFFWGSSPGDAEALSWAYWIGFFGRLEQRLKVILLKERSEGVRVVAAHYAEVGNEVARDYVKRGQGLKVFAREDGKLAFVVDLSLGSVELEALHPVTAGRDAGSVHAFFEGLRGVEGFTPQFMLTSLAHVSASLEEIVEVIREFRGGGV